jgi:anti-anti-sigma factor
MKTEKAIAPMTKSSRTGQRATEEGLMIETISRSTSFLLNVWGNLDWMGSMLLRQVIGDLLRPGTHIVIDLSHTVAIDGVGISALVGTVRRVRAVEGTTQIRNVPANVRHCMDLAGVSQLVTPSPAPNEHRRRFRAIELPSRAVHRYRGRQ